MITARKMLVHARLGIPSIYFAYIHASAILNILPYNDLKTKDGHSCTPFEEAFDQKPRLLLFKVFGCSIVFKRNGPGIKVEGEPNTYLPIHKKKTYNEPHVAFTLDFLQIKQAK